MEQLYSQLVSQLVARRTMSNACERMYSNDGSTLAKRGHTKRKQRQDDFAPTMRDKFRHSELLPHPIRVHFHQQQSRLASADWHSNGSHNTTFLHDVDSSRVPAMAPIETTEHLPVSTQTATKITITSARSSLKSKKNSNGNKRSRSPPTSTSYFPRNTLAAPK